MKIADRYVQGLSQIKFKRDGDTSGHTFAVADDPTCGGQWLDAEIDVEWYFPDDTGLTEGSDTDWTGYGNCTGMA